MKKLLNKKGILGLDTVKFFVLALMTIAVVAVATLIVMDSLKDASTDAGVQGNITLISNNVTSGVVSFFSNSGTFFTLLAVVVIILIISVVIVAVNRFGGSGGGL